MSTELGRFESHFDPADPEVIDRMWEVAEHLQETCPVAYSDAEAVEFVDRSGFWVLTRYGDVREAFQDWRSFTTDIARLTELGVPPSKFGLNLPNNCDPPIHRDYRVLINPYFTPTFLGRFEDRVRAIVADLIEGFIDDGHCELVTQLSKKLPGMTAFRLFFSIDDDDEVARCAAWTDTVGDTFGSENMADGLRQMREWVDELITTRRTLPRRDDVLDSLLYGEVDGRPLTYDELRGTIVTLILGGFITQAHSLSWIVQTLCEHPELQDRLRREPASIPTAIEEVWRLNPPVMLDSRICGRDTTIGGQTIKAGEQVTFHVGAANRDPREFDHPDELDIDRTGNRHVTFGLGLHRCVGSNLARMNMRIAVEEILARMHDIHITPGDSPRSSHSAVMWGPSYLPISFTKNPQNNN